LDTLEVFLQVFLEVPHIYAIASRCLTTSVLPDVGLGGSQPVLMMEQMIQVIELVRSILFCPLTKFSLRFTDIHGDASMFAFGYIAPKHLQAVALRPVYGFSIL
jgi:hypothetical protein